MCLNVRFDVSNVFDPNVTDEVFTTVPLTTAGLDVDEYERIRKEAKNYEFARFVGASFAIKRTGDTNGVFSVNAANPATMVAVSINNRVVSRYRVCDDKFNDLTEMQTNPEGITSGANVKTVPSYGYCKIATYHVPVPVMQSKWQAAATVFPVIATGAVPGQWSNVNIQNLMGLSGYYNNNGINPKIPAVALLQCDSFPDQYNAASIGAGTLTTRHITNFTLYKRFYVELQGPGTGAPDF